MHRHNCRAALTGQAPLRVRRAIRPSPGRSSMRTLTAVVVCTVAMGASSLAQQGLVIRATNRQVEQADAERVYFSACSAVEREFRINRSIRPQVTLVVGAGENRAYWKSREIRLKQWDPYLFAQGVVIFAFEDLLPEGERNSVARRAVTWADSTVEAKRFAK
jgi:hypothetical protein